jgi:hypothetical protein
MDAYHPAYRRDSCVTCATSSVPSATGLTTVAHAHDCPLGFASRPRDRFAFIEDDGAAGSVSKHHSQPTPSEATRDCGQGEEKRSLATAFPRLPAWSRVGLLALRLHLKPMSRFPGVKENSAKPPSFRSRRPAQPDFGCDARKSRASAPKSGAAALLFRNSCCRLLRFAVRYKGLRRAPPICRAPATCKPRHVALPYLNVRSLRNSRSTCRGPEVEILRFSGRDGGTRGVECAGANSSR